MPFIGTPGWPELVIFGTIALLLFGKRLPEVARSLGKGIVEFKKGLSGVESEVRNATIDSGGSTSSRPLVEEPREEVTAPKFEPPESPPE